MHPLDNQGLTGPTPQAYTLFLKFNLGTVEPGCQ